VESTVALDGISVSLGGHAILRELSLSVNAGETVGIWGLNGSGKTTLVRLLATLLRPQHGAGQILGADITGEQVYPIRPRIGMMGHNPGLIDELTLEENLLHFVNLAGRDVGRVQNALDVVGLSGASERRASASSFGMRRRVEVAYLLIARPDLLLLDEASSGLDVEALDLVGALVDRTTEAGGGVVVVSHDKSVMSSTCDRSLHLTSGHLVEAS
jgi:heme exporter protein A